MYKNSASKSQFHDIMIPETLESSIEATFCGDHLG